MKSNGITGYECHVYFLCAMGVPFNDIHVNYDVGVGVGGVVEFPVHMD